MIVNREQMRDAVLMAVDAALIVVAFFLALNIGSRDFADIHYRWFE